MNKPKWRRDQNVLAPYARFQKANAGALLSELPLFKRRVCSSFAFVYRKPHLSNCLGKILCSCEEIGIRQVGDNRHFFAPHCLEGLKPYPPPHPCCNYSSLTDTEICALIRKFPNEDTLTLTAHPGEIVYIPSCWWHRVVNEGFTISLTNFWQANCDARRQWAYRRIKDIKVT